MIIRYHQLEPSARDAVRALETKGHIAYIRYLLLSRTPLDQFNVELTRLGLSAGTAEQYAIYFSSVLYPMIGRYRLTHYYKPYLFHNKDTRLNFVTTFDNDDIARENFCKLIEETETNLFFSPEIIRYYGKDRIPKDENNKPLIEVMHKGDWADVLLHEKRHVIDGMLGDGHSAKNISKHLDEMYDITLSPLVITHYAKSFMNVQRRGLEEVIEEVNNERNLIDTQLEYVRNNQDLFTIGERVSAISTLKAKRQQLDDQLKRLQGAHSNASYSQGVIEYSDMREIFADVMLRTHRRYKLMDDRTEDTVIDPLSKLVGMMSKATEKMIGLDVAMMDTTKKTVSEEMLEVVLPTLDRVEEEERMSRENYLKSFGYEIPVGAEADEEIIGDDD